MLFCITPWLYQTRSSAQKQKQTNKKKHERADALVIPLSGQIVDSNGDRFLRNGARRADFPIPIFLPFLSFVSFPPACFFFLFPRCTLSLIPARVSAVGRGKSLWLPNRGKARGEFVYADTLLQYRIQKLMDLSISIFRSVFFFSPLYLRSALYKVAKWLEDQPRFVTGANCRGRCLLKVGLSTSWRSTHESASCRGENGEPGFTSDATSENLEDVVVEKKKETSSWLEAKHSYA